MKAEGRVRSERKERKGGLVVVVSVAVVVLRLGSHVEPKRGSLIALGRESADKREGGRGSSVSHEGMSNAEAEGGRTETVPRTGPCRAGQS